MLLVVTLQHVLLCYEGGCAFEGVGVVSDLLDD